MGSALERRRVSETIQMKIHTRQELRNQLRMGKVSPVYLLFGSETYLRNLASRTIADIVLKDSNLREFNDTEISLDEVGIVGALTSAEQRPMIDAKQVVRIKGVCVSGKKYQDNLNENDEVPLTTYLANPSDTTVLIFIADKLDKRRKISRLLLENSFAVEFKPLDSGELIKWAKDRFAGLNVQVDDRTLHLLIDLVGDDVRKLNLEIDKLSTAAMPNSVVTGELVEILVSNSREISNFELTDHLLGNRKPRALRVMKKILDDGAEPLMLLGLLSYNFHRLLMAKEMMIEGVDRTEVSKIMRLPYSKQNQFLETARRTERNKFARILTRLSAADLAIKTSIATPRLQIELLVCELANI